MSEEEIVEIIKSLKDVEIHYSSSYYHTGIVKLNEKEKQALQGLLDLYNKEKEKNKELSERINKSIEFINDNDTFFADGENWQNILHIEELLKGE